MGWKREEEGPVAEGGMGFFMPLFPLVLISLSISAAPSVDAWGKEGHFMVCKIAEKYLTENATNAVLELLPAVAEGDLAAVCSWADEVRFRYRWSSPLHYINTPGVCNFKQSRDCHNAKGEKDMCVVGAINNYTAQLLTYGDSSPSGYNLTESLMFLAHFMGDVHQPLHVGFADDEGGNTIVVRWYRRKTNLHHVWDVSIIETAMKDFYNKDINIMIESIEKNLTSNWADDIIGWETCDRKIVTCATKYASESITLSCNYAYKDVEQDTTLGDEYFFSRFPIVEKRIAQAGVRLAALLNKIFDPTTNQMNSRLQIE
uniref:Aspergillus nuclease S1 n=1 Tax=Anthurium amnicola TaxID=1678845 RepID=A0A1D1YVZ5_9ARAE